MNPQFNMLQEQMRHQQEQLRRQQEMAHWAEQKKLNERQERKKFQTAAPLKQQADVSQTRGALLSDSEFSGVEFEAALLRQAFAAGRLTETQFKHKLKDLMFQDAQGDWWMVGTQSGQWYRFDGANWVLSEQPGHTHLAAIPQSVTPAIAAASYKPRRLLGVVVLILGMALTLITGAFAVDATEYGSTREISLPIGIAIWLTGSILTIIITRKAWRR